jgi:hypothetical protein
MKRTLTIIACAGLIGTCVDAEERLGYTWGNPESSITVEPSLSGSSLFDIVFVNRLSACVGKCENPVSYVLEHNGVEVVVSIMLGDGRRPEEVTLIPESGFRSIPEFSIVEDDETTRFMIISDLLG